MQAIDQPLVGYALNAFPCESFADWWACLTTDVLEIKRRVFPDEIFPIELRFSEQFIQELTPTRVAQLRKFLNDHDLALVTVNAFVMPHFHGAPVKERAYLPAWHASNARLNFTNRCVVLLAELTATVEGEPPGEPFVARPAGSALSARRALAAPKRLRPHRREARPPILRPSVSVPFGALKPVPLEAVAPNILKAGEFAAQHGCRIALEPEPGLCVETTAEVLQFFSAYVPQELRTSLGVNFDLSHQLVQFEDLHRSVEQLQAAGIHIAKIHVSNAAELAELRPFYNDSIYLHQVTGRNAAGQRTFFSLDWPASSPPDIVKYRCHYHLPVFPTEFPSTLGEVEEFLRHPATAALGPLAPFIIETYTWPEQLRGRLHLVDNICRELHWVRERIRLNPH